MVLLINNVKKKFTIMFADRLFLSILWTAMGLFISDGAWILMDDLNFIGAETINNCLNLTYFMLTGVIGLLWLIYSDYKINEDEERLKRRLKWYAIPFVVLVLSLIHI